LYWIVTFLKAEQHHAAIRGKSATIEHSCDFLARTRWQIEAELIIVGHGVAVRRDARRMVSTPIPYASSTLCATPVSSNAGSWRNVTCARFDLKRDFAWSNLTIHDQHHCSVVSEVVL
jgi:hypothetical protein